MKRSESIHDSALTFERALFGQIDQTGGKAIWIQSSESMEETEMTKKFTTKDPPDEGFTGRLYTMLRDNNALPESLTAQDFNEIIRKLGPIDPSLMEGYVDNPTGSELDEALSTLSPKERLVALAAIFAARRAEIDQEEQRAVDEAKESGLTWAEIAEPYGISRQMAQKRWTEAGRNAQKRNRANHAKRYEYVRVEKAAGTTAVDGAEQES